IIQQGTLWPSDRSRLRVRNPIPPKNRLCVGLVQTQTNVLGQTSSSCSGAEVLEMCVSVQESFSSSGRGVRPNIPFVL
ncbi:hypothetical protein AVEN_247396-2-1, partial [Araneus ventricosus]